MAPNPAQLGIGSVQGRSAKAVISTQRMAEAVPGGAVNKGATPSRLKTPPVDARAGIGQGRAQTGKLGEGVTTKIGDGATGER